LFARGGYPWRQTQEPPSGVTSPPGVFAGYAFDTLGTRLGLEVPSNGVTLETLGRYRHVVWIVDPKGGAITSASATDAFPVTVLCYMSDRGQREQPVRVRAGRRPCLADGRWGRDGVDQRLPRVRRQQRGRQPVWTNSDNELCRGRLMYDAAHWQSGFSNVKALVTVQRSPARDEIAASPWAHPDRWTGGEVRSPDYRKLPEVMRPLESSGDLVPPTRLTRQAGCTTRTSSRAST
jgi:hypothetical protein